MKMKFKKMLCKIFGHRFDRVDLIVHVCKNIAENRTEFRGDLLTCKRCGYTHKI